MSVMFFLYDALGLYVSEVVLRLSLLAVTQDTIIHNYSNRTECSLCSNHRASCVLAWTSTCLILIQLTNGSVTCRFFLRVAHARAALRSRKHKKRGERRRRKKKKSVTKQRSFVLCFQLAVKNSSFRGNVGQNPCRHLLLPNRYVNLCGVCHEIKKLLFFVLYVCMQVCMYVCMHIIMQC